MRVNIKDIRKNLFYVGRTFNSDSIGYNRLAFSQEEKEAINWLGEVLIKEGIAVRSDAVGNLFARVGPDNVPTYAFGSHLDTVKHGGLFDGALGIMVALECIIKLKDIAENAAYEWICLIGEEGNPLGGAFGSRLLTGAINLEDVDEKLLKSHGMTMTELKEVFGTLPEYEGFLELHIEQGPVLERNNNVTGIVTNISGIVRNYITVNGESGHSGTVPMEYRKDALVSASEIVQYVNAEANKMDDSTLATIGEFEVMPNSPTIIPGKVKMTLEVRSSSLRSLQKFPKKLNEWIKENYNAKIEFGVEKSTNAMADSMILAIEKAARDIQLETMRLVSGANHDANSLAPYVQTCMIFVPSVGGISHNPKELSKWEYIENAGNIMLRTLINFNK